MNADGLKFRDAIIEFLPDATFVIDLEGKVIMWNSAMEMLTSIPRADMLGKGHYEYALPFYKERRPMLANLIFMPEVEIEKKYDMVKRIDDTLVVEIFFRTFEQAAHTSGQKPARYTTQPLEMLSAPSRQSATSRNGNGQKRKSSGRTATLPTS
jgi:PAS domain S-box-containing protein